jgi:GTPase SAR1 family protein
MPQAACPFCFRKVDTSKLAYQCTGRGPKPCTNSVDDLRLELTHNDTETYPTFPAPTQRGQLPLCPTCGAEARRRACPACHTAVPIGFKDSDSPMIGLIGSKGSGKTVMMTVLVRQLRDSVARKFGASIRLATDSPDGHAGIASYKTQREDKLFTEGDLPFGTMFSDGGENRRRPLVVEWQGPKPGAFGRSAVKSTILSFLDTAGEQLNSLESTYGLDYISACDSIIVALDPFAIPGASARLNLPDEAIQTETEGVPLQVIENVTEMLRVELGVKNNKKIKVPLAVVFTKIDAFFNTMDRGNPIMNPPAHAGAYQDVDGQAVHEHMRAMLHDWNADDIDIHLSHNYDTFRFFGVSSLGAEPDYAQGRIAPGGIRPHRVEDPLLWLMAKERTVKVQ